MALRLNWQNRMRIERGNLTTFPDKLILHLLYESGYIQLQDSHGFTDPKHISDVGDWAGWRIGNYEVVVTRVANDPLPGSKVLSLKKWKAMRGA